MTLNDISIGDEFVISSINGNGEVHKRLIDMGFVSGATGIVLHKALLGDPIEVKIGGYRIAIRLSEARNIVLKE